MTKRSVDYIMPIVLWLRKRGHTVLFPKRHNTCHFIIDDETAVLTIGMKINKHRTHSTEKWYNLNLPYWIKDYSSIEWIYLYFPFDKKRPLYKLRMTDYVAKKQGRRRLSLKQSFETEYPIELIANLASNHHGNGTDHQYVKHGKNGKFLPKGGEIYENSNNN